MPQKSTLDIVSETIDGYLRYLKDVNSVLQHNITIQGSRSNIAKRHSKDDVEALIELIRVFNRAKEMHTRGFRLSRCS